MRVRLPPFNSKGATCSPLSQSRAGVAGLSGTRGTGHAVARAASKPLPSHTSCPHSAPVTRTVTRCYERRWRRFESFRGYQIVQHLGAKPSGWALARTWRVSVAHLSPGLGPQGDGYLGSTPQRPDHSRHRLADRDAGLLNLQSRVRIPPVVPKRHAEGRAGASGLSTLHAPRAGRPETEQSVRAQAHIRSSDSQGLSSGSSEDSKSLERGSIPRQPATPHRHWPGGRLHGDVV